MTLIAIDISKQLARMKQLLKEDKSVPDSSGVMVEMMVLIIELLLNMRTLNSKNSSKPPSTDPGAGSNKKVVGTKPRQAARTLWKKSKKIE